MDQPGSQLRQDLEDLRVRLQAELEVAKGDGRAVAQLSRELRAVSGQLAALPPAKGVSAVDEVAKKREARRSRAATKGQA